MLCQIVRLQNIVQHLIGLTYSVYLHVILKFFTHPRTQYWPVYFFRQEVPMQPKVRA